MADEAARRRAPGRAGRARVCAGVRCATTAGRGCRPPPGTCGAARRAVAAEARGHDAPTSSTAGARSRWPWRAGPACRRERELLYDVRGFFADERVEIRLLARGGLLDRAGAARRGRQPGARRRARGPDRGRPGRLRSGAEPAAAARACIPTCGGPRRASRPAPPGSRPEYGLAYSGSLGTWYLAREMVAFARRGVAALVPGRSLFLTPQVAARRARPAPPTRLGRVVQRSPRDVPAWLRRARACLLLHPPHARQARLLPDQARPRPWPAGCPWPANRGIGDLDRSWRRSGVGVLRRRGARRPRTAPRPERLAALLGDPGAARALPPLAEKPLRSGAGRSQRIMRSIG